MSAADPGESFLNDLIGEQVESSVMKENDDEFIDDHLDNNDGHFSSQTIASANDHDIYGLPNTGPGDDSSTETVIHTTENGHDIHLPPSNISISRDINTNEDAPSHDSIDHQSSTTQPPTPTIWWWWIYLENQRHQWW